MTSMSKRPCLDTTPRGKSAGRQAHLQYEKNSDSEEDTYDDKFRAEDLAHGLMFLNPFGAHQVFEQQIQEMGKGQSVDVRHAGGKLHVPLHGSELELSKRKKEGGDKKPIQKLKMPFFASERTRIRELIKQVEARKAAEEEERERIEKQARAARRRERREQHKSADDRSIESEMSTYWGQYSTSARGAQQGSSSASFYLPPVPPKSLVDIAMASNSAQIKALAHELQNLQSLLLQKKAREKLKGVTH